MKKLQHNPIWIFALAAFVSIGSIALAQNLTLLLTGSAISPFASIELVLLHALASLPLAYLAARLLCKQFAALRRPVLSWAMFGAGILIAVITVSFGQLVGRTMAADQTGFIARLIVRGVWCVALAVPWIVFAQRDTSPATTRGSFGSIGDLLLAVIVAFLLPATFLNTQIERSSDKVIAFMRGVRTLKARDELQWLCDVGSQRTFSMLTNGTQEEQEFTCYQLLAEQKQLLEHHRAEVQQLSREDQQRSNELMLAKHLFALDKLDRAASTLRVQAESDMIAAMELGRILQEQKKWDKAETVLLLAIELAESSLAQRGGSIKMNIEIRRKCYDLLARSAGQLREYDRAEKYYLEGIEKLPTQEAFFQFRLAKFYMDSGRARLAIERARRAAELNPKPYRQLAQKIYRKAGHDSPFCLQAPWVRQQEEPDVIKDGE